MTVEKIEDILDQINMPWAYYSFNASGKKASPPPYIVYLSRRPEHICADNKVSLKISNFTLELYTDFKDLLSEASVEGILDLNNIVYEKDEAYIDDQNLFEIIYALGGL